MTLKASLSIAALSCVFLSCATPLYVMPDQAEVEKLCHVFILNDFNDATWFKSMKIKGIEWQGSAPTITSQGYNVYPAPIGPISLSLEYSYDGTNARASSSREVNGNCKQGTVFFAYVQSKIVYSAKWPQGYIEMDARSKELANPVASELLDIFKTNRPIYIKRLAAYVLDAAPADYLPKQ